MRIRPTLSALALLALVSAAAGACGSSSPDANDPICGGNGSQSFATMCSTIQNAIATKCTGTIACSDLVSGTSCSDTTKVFCVDTTNADVTSITSAADCNAVKALTLAYKCHS